MNQNKESECVCCGKTTLIFPCSGASDIGEIADRAGRICAQSGCGKMFCLAGIGANLSHFIDSAKNADRLLVIDGCGTDCARKTLAEKGITANIVHVRVTDLGFAKGKSPATGESIKVVAEEMGRKLNASFVD